MRKKCQMEGCIVLTYDDGPSMEMTPELLDLLEQTQTKATFFILGNKVAGNMPIVQRMVALGHEIGCHGYGHLNAWKVLPWTEMRDVTKGIETLSSNQIDCKIFRPPYGKITIFTLAVNFFNNIKSVWWTIVSGDTFDLLPDPIVFSEKVISAGGGVVLMHDMHKNIARKEYVLKVTSQIIKEANRRRLSIKTLGEIL